MFRPLPPVRRGVHESGVSLRAAQKDLRELNLVMQVAYLEAQVEGLNNRVARAEKEIDQLRRLIDRRFG
jgi:uncharacterized coiled-coil protein SlyX